MAKTYSKSFFQEAGRKGGITTAKRGRKFFEEIGKKGGTKRWSDSRQTKKTGIDSPNN